MGPGKRTEPHTRPPSHGGLDHGEAQLHGDHQKVHNMSLGLKVEKGPEVFGGVELGEVFNQKV